MNHCLPLSTGSFHVGFNMITQKDLKQYLEYLPETGEFFANKKSINRPAGRKLGTVHSTGYVVIRIKDKLYKAHRLAWLYMTGEFPGNVIDHINRDKKDNRFVNLRDVTRSDNSENNPIKRSNSSGFVGVSWYAPTKKWRARIMYGYKGKHLGYFQTPQEAHEAYCVAAKKYHNFNPFAKS